MAYSASKEFPVEILDRLHSDKKIRKKERFNKQAQYRILQGLYNSEALRSDYMEAVEEQMNQLEKRL